MPVLAISFLNILACSTGLAVFTSEHNDLLVEIGNFYCLPLHSFVCFITALLTLYVVTTYYGLALTCYNILWSILPDSHNLATFHFSLCILLPIMVKPFFLQVRSSPGFDYSDATCYVGAWLKHGWMSASVPSGLHLRVLMMAFMSVRSILGLGYFVPCAILQFCLARFFSTIYCYLYLWNPIVSCGIFTLARFSIFAMLGLIRPPLQL